MRKTILISGIFLASFSWLSMPVRGQPRSSEYQAITIADPSIPIKELEFMVKPLMEEELEVEANAWLNLLRIKVEEVSNAEIIASRRNEELTAEKEVITDLAESEKALKKLEKIIKKSPAGLTVEEAEKDLVIAQKKLLETQKELTGIVEKEATIQQDEALVSTLAKAEEDAAEVLAQAESTESAISAEQETLKEILAETTVELTILDATEIDDLEKIDQARQKIKQTKIKLEKAVANQATIKTQLLFNLTEVRDAQTAVGERLEVIIEELEKKGGDVDRYQQYLSAVGLIAIDVNDGQALWIAILGWLKSDTGGIRWGINLGKFVVIVVISVMGSSTAAKVAGRSLQMIPNLSELLRGFLVGIVRQGTLVMGVLFALTALGISLGPLLTVFGGVSFVLAFALQNNLGNLASGLMIMFYKPFDEGDEIRLGELWGYVDSISVVSTKIRGWSGEIINVPNDTVWNSNIINLTHNQSRGFTGTIIVDLTQDVSQAQQVILDAIESHPGVLKEPAPRTLVWEIDGDSMNIMFFGHIKTQEYWQVHEAVLKLIQKGINEAGIAIDIPEQRIQIESVEKSNNFSKILPTD